MKGDPPSKVCCRVCAIESRLISERILAMVARSLSHSAFVVTGTVCEPREKYSRVAEMFKILGQIHKLGQIHMLGL